MEYAIKKAFEDVPDCIHHNQDAQTLEVSSGGTICVVVKETIIEKAVTVPVNIKGASLLSTFVNLTNQISRSGNSSPIVFHDAFKDLKVDDFFVWEIAGLAVSTLPGAYGIVILTKTRKGNESSKNSI